MKWLLTKQNVINWMNTWEQMRDTAIPIRFKEDFLESPIENIIPSRSPIESPLPSNEDEFKDLALEAMDFYWRHCIDQLERKDLGDVERKNFESLRNKLHHFITK